MFIRKVKKTNGRTKKRYTYLQLVESIRTDRGPRQQLILNLGDLAIDPSQYKALAKRIEDILTGRKSFLEVDETVEKFARAAAKKIFSKQAKEIDTEVTSDFCNVYSELIGFPHQTKLTICLVGKTITIGNIEKPNVFRYRYQYPASLNSKAVRT